MKTRQLALFALIGLGATSVAAEPLYTAKVEIQVGSAVVTTFGITDTMYGLTLANCDTRAKEWASDFATPFVEGTDAVVATRCLAIEGDGSFEIATSTF